MIALVKWTLWQRRWSTLWWSVGVFALIFINMIFYPTFKDQADELQKSFESLPDAAVQLFGGSTDFFSSVGFLNSQIFFFMLPLLLGVLAIGLGSSLIGRDEQDKTIENLLARPVSRSKLLAVKGLAGIIILLVASITAALTTLITALIVDLDIAAAKIVQVTAVCFLLALSFGAITYVLTATGRARAASIGIGTTIALGGYLVSSLAGTVTWLNKPSKIFPFEYYQSEAILRGTYNWASILFFLAIVLVAGLVSWLSFRRRDLG